MTNNIEKKLTSTEIIIDEIANTILSGELKPGDKLLTEREFAEKYHVTRSWWRQLCRRCPERDSGKYCIMDVSSKSS